MSVDPKGLEAARKAVGTIPGARLWSDIEKAISAYLVATEPVGPKLWGRYPGTGVWHQIADGSNTDEQVAGFEATYARSGWTELRRDNPFAATSPAGDLAATLEAVLAEHDADRADEAANAADQGERPDLWEDEITIATHLIREAAQALRYQSTGVTGERAALLAEVISLIEDDMYGPGEANGVAEREAFNQALRRQINRITSRMIVPHALSAQERG